MTKSEHVVSLVKKVRQSPPVDTALPYDPTTISGKTIVVTGGASGFGERFFRKWAELGANVIIGDINDTRGHSLVAEVRASTGNQNLHYVNCNVTSWQSQVDFFRTAAQLSPHGGIDAVVANAGISDHQPTFESPQNLDAPSPPPPNLLCFEVNMIGVLYTTHLAFFYLPRNSSPTQDQTSASKNLRDRHLLLIGSCASLEPIPGQLQYTVSKHGVLGLFRSLRGTAFMNGIRVNMLCPYFIDTPILPTAARVLLAGGGMGKPEDVIDAGTRIMADRTICGRSLVIGPKMKINLNAEGDIEFKKLPHLKDGKEIAVWEAYADDFEDCEVFVRRFNMALNYFEAARGWAGWSWDMLKAFAYPFERWLK